MARTLTSRGMPRLCTYCSASSRSAPSIVNVSSIGGLSFIEMDWKGNVLALGLPLRLQRGLSSCGAREQRDHAGTRLERIEASNWCLIRPETVTQRNGLADGFHSFERFEMKAALSICGTAIVRRASRARPALGSDRLEDSEAPNSALRHERARCLMGMSAGIAANRTDQSVDTFRAQP